jgi:hypothetical protein
MTIRVARSLLFAVLIALPLAAQAAIHVFLASLDAAQEVQTPPVDSPGVGSTILAFDDLTNSFDLTLGGVGLTTQIVAAHFHRAPFGMNGPIVKDLGVPASFAQDDGYAFHAIYLNAAAGGLLLTDLLAGNIYVNVHTQRFPDGEVRGQLGQLVPIPEPGTWALLAGGLLLLATFRLNRRQSD